jgi:hypothetical protein
MVKRYLVLMVLCTRWNIGARLGWTIQTISLPPKIRFQKSDIWRISVRQCDFLDNFIANQLKVCAARNAVAVTVGVDASTLP